tara:strand:- start:1005 stop:1151 length:147 start_codon:yes stop_codon:yes gene_type:complete
MSDIIMVALEKNQGHAMEMIKEINKNIFIKKSYNQNKKRVVKKVLISI